jgi:hypothetical protein
MVRVALACATAGALIAFALLGLSVCCFDYIPSGRFVYAVLWPTTLLLSDAGDPVRPERSEYLILLAAFANAIPYGLVGALAWAGYRRTQGRRSG